MNITFHCPPYLGFRIGSHIIALRGSKNEVVGDIHHPFSQSRHDAIDGLSLIALKLQPSVLNLAPEHLRSLQDRAINWLLSNNYIPKIVESEGEPKHIVFEKMDESEKNKRNEVQILEHCEKALKKLRDGNYNALENNKNEIIKNIGHIKSSSRGSFQ